jgi:REP element-mobilizing transposase RayT
LVQPLIDDNGKFFKISTIVQRIKTYTAKNINMILNRNGKVWDDDYFDRYIRNDKDYYNVINYILNNPVKAGLSEQIEDWQFSYYKPINIFFEDF